MKKSGITVGLALGLVLTGLVQAEKPQGSIKTSVDQKLDFPFLAKISLIEATDIAEKQVPGAKAFHLNLWVDKEGNLNYMANLYRPDLSVVNVEVDAGTGAILSVEEDKEDSK
jgi:uncharacterized membrane protein YkoI